MPEENAEVTEEQLIQAASQYDAAIEAGETPEVTIEEQPESDEGDVAEIKEQMQEEAEQEEQASDAEEQSSSEEPEPEEKAEEKPVSKYEKNRRRQSEAWEKINSQKEEAKKREAELEKREKELEEQTGIPLMTSRRRQKSSTKKVNPTWRQRPGNARRNIAGERKKPKSNLPALKSKRFGRTSKMNCGKNIRNSTTQTRSCLRKSRLSWLPIQCCNLIHTD